MIVPVLAGVAALFAGYKLFIEKKPRFVGDLAKVGDDVQVSVNNLSQNNKDLPKMPADATFVLVKVKGADADRLQGPIVAFGNVRIPAEIGSFVVHRVLVDKVIRNGKQATSPVGPGSTFTGERKNRFRG